MTDTPDIPLDPKVLAALFGDDQRLIATILVDFSNSLDAYLREFAAADDLSQVRAVAHKLKSSARTVGAGPLADLCAALERACLDGEAEVVRELVPRIAPEVMRVKASLAP
ncbi:Hpt domain-containing protein [Simiduia sp. 21SJ11W-1]|uniref:Hpt domain-containing protein n=1 Tax=Simiduia sp. 21SJ11W-1 TaxID=2909669 RepID=UPI00209F8B94|nr:Hpt domain-containing protein [Simiduia sp. 21SJ11W-1]UTA47533.1 Hpt domain-containing protein [Simiduia sp. 21SJ11W-1]